MSEFTFTGQIKCDVTQVIKETYRGLAEVARTKGEPVPPKPEPWECEKWSACTFKGETGGPSLFGGGASVEIDKLDEGWVQVFTLMGKSAVCVVCASKLVDVGLVKPLTAEQRKTLK